MKKVFLSFLICCSIFSFDSNAAGIEISVEKGIREWSPDGSTSACIGAKKACKFTIKVDIPILHMSSVSGLSAGDGGVFNNSGQLTICLPVETLSDAYWSELFEGSYFSMSADYTFTPEEKSALGTGCPDNIPAGEYTYIIDEGVVKIAINY